MNIVITGASSGIGQALALKYAAPGVNLGLLGRDAQRLEDVATSCKARGANAARQVLDVTDREGMAAWLTGFDEAYPIDLLIANAGVGGGFADPASEENFEDARAMFAINIDGVCNTIDPILPRMARRGGGQVAMMGSLAGFRGLSGAPGYAASKGFVKLYGEGLRGAFAPHGVKVNVICPGFVESRLTLLNKFPMPFFMHADEAADIIARGLKKNRARIAFPWPMVFGVWFLSVLPAGLSDWIVRRLPKKN
jgi:short-subunit dehydrogenase